MAAPSYIPTAAKPPSVYRSPPRRPGSWAADRPGEVVGRESEAEDGPGLGDQGPDQGYLLKLARRAADSAVLAPGEQLEDVMAACCAVALRRASLFGRAPITHDLTLALDLFGYLDEAPPELIAWRRPLTVGAAGGHGYSIRRRLAGMVPEDTLRSTQTAVSEARSENWQTPLGL